MPDGQGFTAFLFQNIPFRVSARFFAGQKMRPNGVLNEPPVSVNSL
jgi:hypothetical protein